MKIIKYSVPALLFVILITFYSCNFGSGVNDAQLPSKSNIFGSVTGFNNIPLQNIVVTAGYMTANTDSYGYFNFYDYFPDEFDIYLKDPARNYNILYKNLITGSSYMHLPLASNQNYDEFTINVQFQSIPTPAKGKLYYISPSGIVVAQNIDSSSIISMRIPNTGYYYSYGSVVFVSYTTDVNGKITAYKYYGNYDGINLVPGGTTTVIFTAGLIKTLGTSQYPCNIIPAAGNTNINATLVFNFNYYGKIYADIYSQSIDKFTGNNFTVLLPTNTGALYFKPLLNITSDCAGGYAEEMKMLTSGTSGDFTLSGIPVVTTPANYATNVDANTVFSIERQNISKVIIFTLNDSAAGKSYNLCTSENNITMGLLSKMVTLKPNTTYSYSVQQVGVNANYVSNYLSYSQDLTDYKGTAQVRYFTTKP